MLNLQLSKSSTRYSLLQAMRTLNVSASPQLSENSNTLHGKQAQSLWKAPESVGNTGEWPAFRALRSDPSLSGRL